jgi:hypothetical protein
MKASQTNAMNDSAKYATAKTSNLILAVMCGTSLVDMWGCLWWPQALPLTIATLIGVWSYGQWVERTYNKIGA